MIIGTAGHIDHGKTSLIKALTGVDADRLPEEKTRGMTIDLGFAYLATPGGAVLGFVDVPGHEKFVHTMAAGAYGMHHAILLVAADDGIMPQTREHLRVLDLLGVPGLTLVISKADLAEPARLSEVTAASLALIAQTRFGAVDTHVVSTRDGRGIDTLRAALIQRPDAGGTTCDAGFRLAIDRVFVVRGMGVAVTGAVIAGETRIGDTLRLAQQGSEVRVRSIHAQNVPAQSAGPGMRCGLVISGAELADVERGDWLVDGNLATLTQRIDCAVSVPADAQRSLRDGELVLLHHGTGHRNARLILLNAATLEPGQSAYAQCVLDRPMHVCWHDRMVLRDGSARHTLAGAVALDPGPPVRGRKRADRIAVLDCLRIDNPLDAINQMLERCEDPVNVSRWSRDMNIGSGALLQAIPENAMRLEANGETWVLGAGGARSLAQRVGDGLAKFHQSEPDEPGLSAERLRRMCAPALPQALFRAWIPVAIGQGQLALTGSFVHLPGHRVELSAPERILWERALPLLLESGFDPPWVRDLAQALSVPQDAMRSVLRKQARQSALVQIVNDLFYPDQTMRKIAGVARALIGRDGALSVVQFRDALNIGRKRAIQILEACDRLGLTRRLVTAGRNNKSSEKDHRILRNPDLFGPGET